MKTKKYLVSLVREQRNWIVIEATCKDLARVKAVKQAPDLLWTDEIVSVSSVEQLKYDSAKMTGTRKR